MAINIPDYSHERPTDPSDWEYAGMHILPDSVYADVRVSKVGGGTIGRAYDGAWHYQLTPGDGRPVMEGSAYHAATPMTHEQVAEAVKNHYEGVLAMAAGATPPDLLDRLEAAGATVVNDMRPGGVPMVMVRFDQEENSTPATSETSTNTPSVIRTHYHAGWNVPGSAPVVPYRTFSSSPEATNYLLAAIEAEACDCDPADPLSELCYTCGALAEIQGLESYEHGFVVLHPDENLLYCLHACTSEHRDLTDLRVGREFLHAKFINEQREPALCRITKVGEYDVYYRVGVENGAPGNKFTKDKGRFLKESLGTWID